MRSGESEYLPESYICESNVRQPVLHTSLLSLYSSAATRLNAPSCRPVISRVEIVLGTTRRDTPELRRMEGWSKYATAT